MEEIDWTDLGTALDSHHRNMLEEATLLSAATGHSVDHYINALLGEHFRECCMLIGVQPFMKDGKDHLEIYRRAGGS